jgi:hypothetical protein
LQQELSNDRKYFDVDSVELVKAAPSAGRSQTFEELSHHQVIHIVRAVEDNALLGKSLSEILC